MITLSTSSGPKKPAYHHGDLREALLTACLAMLEEGTDPATLSLRETARRAGVSAMAPYRHFADREALLAAIAEIGFARLGNALREAASQGEARDALNGQGVAYVAFACANPALFRLMFGSKAPGKTAALADVAGAAFQVLADGVARVAPPETAHDLAMASWSIVHGLAMLAVDGQLASFAPDPIALTRRILETTFGAAPQKGIGAPSQAKNPPDDSGGRPSTTRSR